MNLALFPPDLQVRVAALTTYVALRDRINVDKMVLRHFDLIVEFVALDFGYKAIIEILAQCGAPQISAGTLSKAISRARKVRHARKPHSVCAHAHVGSRRATPSRGRRSLDDPASFGAALRTANLAFTGETRARVAPTVEGSHVTKSRPGDPPSASIDVRSLKMRESLTNGQILADLMEKKDDDAR